ncbi:MAG: WHG domain-containing protein [Anaerolineaceae bacterium]|nr:WHG domain-containing protein [Anaerolineaceae bacterium]
MPRPRAGKVVLDRAAVVRKAAALVNAEGAAGLTINRLARELGVQPPSLYNHISGLADLRHELALLSTQALGECIINAVIGKSGADGIIAAAQAYRKYIKDYPGLYQSSLRASGNFTLPDPALGAAEERVVQVILALIDSLGLTGEDAIHAARAFRSIVHGFTMLEVAGGFGIPLDLDESFTRLVQMLVRGIEKEGKRIGQVE